MFGADTPLVLDALQMAAVIALITGGAVCLFLRHRASKESTLTSPAGSDTLESRVRVLERIATDRSAELAHEIEQLRHEKEVN